MAVLSTELTKAIFQILDEWADKQLEAALSRLSSKQLKSSGALRESLKKEIAIVAGVKARAAIQYLYYGTILDRDFIQFWRGAGKKGVSTDKIEQWLKDGGMSKMGGYKGQAKSEARQLRDMAWKIRRSWKKKGGRKGRKWNFRKDLEISSDELLDQIGEAFKNDAYESILANLN